MNWALGLATYLVIWWVMLFAILPFGIVSQREAGEVVPGSDPGAPHRPQLLKRLLANTIVAAVIWVIVDQLYRIYVLD
jgi:predicted secreted protein